MPDPIQFKKPLTPLWSLASYTSVLRTRLTLLMNDINLYDLAWDMYCDMDSIGSSHGMTIKEVLVAYVKDCPEVLHIVPELNSILTDMFKSAAKETALWNSVHAYLEGEGYDPTAIRGDGLHQVIMDWSWNGESLPAHADTLFADGDGYEAVSVPLVALLGGVQ